MTRPGRTSLWTKTLALACAAGACLVATSTATAAPTLRSTSTMTSSSPVNAASVAKPSGVANDDVMLAAIDVRLASAGSISAPSGWTLVRADTNGGAGVNLTQAIYLRVAGSLEPSSYTWTFSKSCYVAAAILAYSGADRAAPVLAHNGRFTPDSQWITAPSVTTAAADASLIGVFGSNGSGSVTPPAAMTERYDVSTKAVSGAAKSAGADEIRASAGATGDRAAFSSAVHRSTIGQLVALRPAGTPPPPPPPPPPPGVGTALPAALPQSTGTTFYVATTGSDANAGTQASPWRTVQKALNTLQPGQRALVRAGTYTQDIVFSRAGTASAPITVAAYSGERPVLHAASTSGDTYPIRITGSYFRLNGFVLENAKGISSTNVYFEGSTHHVELSANEIRYGQDQGVFAEATTSALQLLRNRIHHNGWGHVAGQHQSHGLYVEGRNHLIANNVIHDHPYGFGIQIYPQNTGTIIVANSVVASGFAGIVVGGPGGVSNIAIRNNVFANNSQEGVAHDNACPTSTVVDHNVLYGNGGGAIESGCSGIDASGGNRTTNPLFVDYAGRDLHLQAGSSAIDYGLAAYSPTVDHDGRSRPQGVGPDAGAYER